MRISIEKDASRISIEKNASLSRVLQVKFVVNHLSSKALRKNKSRNTDLREIITSREIRLQQIEKLNSLQQVEKYRARNFEDVCKSRNY